jgi:hypothetical protein
MESVIEEKRKKRIVHNFEKIINLRKFSMPMSISTPTSSSNTNTTKSMIPNSAILIADGIGRLNDFFGRDLFTFVVNREEFTVTIVEALLLSPYVVNELKSDNTTQRFVIKDSRIESFNFSIIVSLFRSERVLLKSSSRKSQIVLLQKLGN